MALQVPQNIYQRLVAVIDDLRNAVRQEAAKAFLASLTNVEPVEFHPQTEECGDSLMEFINEDYMTDANSPSYPAPFSPSNKNEDSSLRMTNSQIEGDTCCPAPSPHTVNPISLDTSTTPGPSEHWRESEARQKRGKSDYNMLAAVAQGSSEQARRLQSHLILRHLDIEDDLHQWRRSIAERRNLNGYNTFLTEAKAKLRTERSTRWSGERSSSQAHTEYLARIYSDRTLKDYKRAKQGFQKDLRHGRR
ncbi:hypothetical protein OEA41_009603 [Lepraria neglecta]|uniref:Uncharacterized protein n=1 Tax=Lepraria neglecta TaxID=209136 RepID=A0AAE0DH18_9LECA|nr:hypothetical protein OEA41_009603 [Lepraria neglecta]